MVVDTPVRPDQVSVGVLATVVPRDVVDEAVRVCGVGSRRADGKLPPHVTAYLTMGLILFGDEPYEDVVRCVTGSLDRWGCWDAAWIPPTASAVTQARKRLGPRVMVEIAESVFGPVAGQVHPDSQIYALGRARDSFGCGRRLVSIDGFDLDLPDSAANAAEFGYSGSGANRSAFPKARVVTLAECGTRVLLAAEVESYSVGESTMAARIYPRLREDELLVADRNFYSFPAWCSAADTGAALVWRAPTGLNLAVVRVLPDGTYLTVLIDSKVRGPRRERLIAAARADADLDPDLARLARVVEYNVTDREGSGTGEAIVVLSTLIDPGEADAEEIAIAYQRRWEHESAIDEIKTHLRGPGVVLRSRLPELAYQEIWALLIVHHAVNTLIAKASAAADPHPERISYTRVLRMIRHSATGTAAFPP